MEEASTEAIDLEAQTPQWLDSYRRVLEGKLAEGTDRYNGRELADIEEELDRTHQAIAKGRSLG